MGLFKFSVIKLDNKFDVKMEIIKKILIYLSKLEFKFIDKAMLSMTSRLTNLNSFNIIWSYKPIHRSLENKLQYLPYYNLVGYVSSFMKNHRLFTLLLNDKIIYPTRYIVYIYLCYLTPYMFYVVVIDRFSFIAHIYHKIYVNNNTIILIKLIESDIWDMHETYLNC